MHYIYRPEIMVSQNRKDFFKPHDATHDGILEDALNIWSKFQEQAQPLQDTLYVPAETCDHHPTNYRLHHAWVKGDESGINGNNRSERFLSLYHLLNATKSFMASDDYGDVFCISNVYDKRLKQDREVKIDVCVEYSRLDNGEEVIHLNADYSKDTIDREGLPAPITLVPFNAIRKALTTYVKEAFTTWDKPFETNSKILLRDYSDHRFTEYGDGRVPKWMIYLPLIERCCKDLDKNFTLHWEFFKEFLIEVVNEADLIKAKSLFASAETLADWSLNKDENKKVNPSPGKSKFLNENLLFAPIITEPRPLGSDQSSSNTALDVCPRRSLTVAAP